MDCLLLIDTWYDAMPGHWQRRQLGVWLGRIPWPPCPGNFGGGSTGPGQIFLGITGTPPSVPGRGGRPEPCAAKSEPPGHKPQTTRGRRERLESRVSYQQSAIGTHVGFSKQIPTRGSRLRIWFLDVVHRPAVLKGNSMDQNQADGNEVSHQAKACIELAR
jgi:hypothetical protein